MGKVTNRIINFLEQHGKRYKPALCPEFIERGKVGECYEMSLAMAYINKQVRYVEGIAVAPDTKEWILHAWVTDGEHAYDPTWRAFNGDKHEVPVPTVYIGIELDTDLSLEFFVSTGYKGIFANYKRDRLLGARILKAKL